MERELAARSRSGARLVELVEAHAGQFSAAAARHDSENTFVRDNFAAMRASGVLAATAPEPFGGLGVDSVHDLAVAVSRLARACPATAIAANMHLGFVLDAARTFGRLHPGDAFVAPLRTLLKVLGRGRMVISHAATEPGGRALSSPSTAAEPVEGGYRVTGHKIFATNSAIADAFTVFLRVPDGAGRHRMGTAIIRRDTEGLTVSQSWDALGMRGSGSHDVRFAECFVPASMVRLGARIGDPAPELWPGLIAVNFPLVGAYLGIAEAAFGIACDVVRTRRKDRVSAQLAVAEMVVDLAAARAALHRGGELADEFLALGEHEYGEDDVTAVVSEFQCAKLIVNRAAARVVDAAMTLAGGASYLTGHPLGRLYRDVRAGPFMQPYSPHDALEFIGRAALGLDPFAGFATPAPQLAERR